MGKKWIAILVAILAGAAAGCSLAGQSPAGATETLPPGPSQNNEWPAFLPADIPVLAGDIETVMGSGQDYVRLFYAPLTKNQVEQYIQQCKQQGYSAEYIVYTREGFPDNSAERLQAGDYDAVELRKGEYTLRLEYGSDSVTLDIEVAGVTTPVQPDALVWPEDIRVAVPQPDRCQVKDIARLSSGGYQIGCEYADGDIHFEQYLQRLTGLGYQETDRLLNDQNEIVSVKVENQSWSVTLNLQAFASRMTLMIQPKSP